MFDFQRQLALWQLQPCSIPWLICAALYILQTTGKIYVTSCSTCHPTNREKSSDDNVESCDTFRLIAIADDKSYSGRFSFFHPLDRSVVTFGGYAVVTNDKVCGVLKGVYKKIQHEKGPNCISVPVQDGVGGGLFSYAYCYYDLQEFQLEAKPDDGDEEMKYKAGHSHVKTGLGYIMVQNRVARLNSACTVGVVILLVLTVTSPTPKIHFQVSFNQG